MSWPVQELRATAAELHARPLPSPATRLVTVCRATERALVLGSTQPPPAAPPAIAVARRRSGGGAVIVGPEELLWVDVTIPIDDPFWERDVGRAFYWLGEAWARALASIDVETEVHRGGLVCTPWSRQVCFGGVGPGEVTMPGGGKVVGIAQRRTRDLAMFQCAALLRWDPASYADALDLPARAAGDLAASGAPLVDRAADDVLSALLDALP